MKIRNLLKNFIYKYFKKDSHYYSDTNDNHINHRAYIGDKWDEIGKLQFHFLKNQGLKPHHKLIDIGCGSLRGGIHFIRYLNNFNYYGTDINNNLIDLGLKKELDVNLRDKINKNNFLISDDFNFNFDVDYFDYAIALSVFTHLRKNNIVRCLKNLNKKINNGIFYATFFIVDKKFKDVSFNQSNEITTYSYKDPFHYTLEEITDMASESNFKIDFIENFLHPRNQKMIAFIKNG
jgi:cyclopropane fatty-acyl-phospholipid synthase-like methyltransferase